MFFNKSECNLGYTVEETYLSSEVITGEKTDRNKTMVTVNVKHLPIEKFFLFIFPTVHLILNIVIKYNNTI